MQVTLQISNVDENLIKAIRSVVHLYPQAKLKVKKQKLTENGYTPEFEAEILKDSRELKASYAKGEVKAYSVKEFREALNNGTI